MFVIDRFVLATLDQTLYMIGGRLPGEMVDNVWKLEPPKVTENLEKKTSEEHYFEDKAEERQQSGWSPVAPLPEPVR